MTFTMADTIGGSIGLLPNGLPAYASYVDNYRGFTELQKLKGGKGAMLLSITIFGNRAQCADFEQGGMVNSQAAGWLDHVAEPDPWLYTFASNAQALEAAAGNRKHVRWWAHTGQGPHICGAPGRIYPSNPGCQYPDADITQYVFNPGGQNLDLSIGDPRLLGPPPPPADPHGYQRFASNVRKSPFGKITERDVVLHYDGARKHWYLPWEKWQLDHDLRPKLHWLADDLFAWAHKHPAGPDNVWNKEDGWRYQMLIRRANGERFA